MVLLKKLKQQVMVLILEQYQSHHLKLLWKPGVEMGVEPWVELGPGWSWASWYNWQQPATKGQNDSSWCLESIMGTDRGFIGLCIEGLED